MKSAFQIGKIAGIPVRLHLTFLAIIPVIAYIFAITSVPFFGKLYGFGAVEPPLIRWIYSFVFAILLFVCVGLHELGHSMVAMRYGIKIKSITLYIIGGVAAMEEIPRKPSKEALMAVAGPAVSGVIGAICIILGSQLPIILNNGHPFTTLLWTLGIINIILMGFNLIPAFPMDGGRILRAGLATKMPYVAATRQAASIGKIFAVIMGLMGIIPITYGQPINPWLIIIASFIYIGASEEAKATSISVSLEGIQVKDIMSTDLQTVSPDMTVRELLNMMFHEKHRSYPVLQNNKLAGIVTLTDVQKVDKEIRDSTNVGEIMVKKIYVIEPHAGASEAMKKMVTMRIRRLPVMENGNLVGVLSRSDLLRAVELCSE